MKVNSEILMDLMQYAKRRHANGRNGACRIEITAGWGCTVVEIFVRDRQVEKLII